jgi:hypothetical protein
MTKLLVYHQQQKYHLQQCQITLLALVYEIGILYYCILNGTIMTYYN